MFPGQVVECEGCGAVLSVTEQEHHLCDASTPKKDYTRDIIQAASGPAEHHCTRCGTGFHSRYSLLNHTMQCAPYHCPRCHEGFDTGFDVQVHRLDCSPVDRRIAASPAKRPYSAIQLDQWEEPTTAQAVFDDLRNTNTRDSAMKTLIRQQEPTSTAASSADQMPPPRRVPTKQSATQQQPPQRRLPGKMQTPVGSATPSQLQPKQQTAQSRSDSRRQAELDEKAARWAANNEALNARRSPDPGHVVIPDHIADTDLKPEGSGRMTTAPPPIPMPLGDLAGTVWHGIRIAAVDFIDSEGFFRITGSDMDGEEATVEAYPGTADGQWSHHVAPDADALDAAEAAGIYTDAVASLTYAYAIPSSPSASTTPPMPAVRPRSTLPPHQAPGRRPRPFIPPRNAANPAPNPTRPAVNEEPEGGAAADCTDLVPYVPPVAVCVFPFDIDMIAVELPIDLVPTSEFLTFKCTIHPVAKVHPGIPGTLLQLCPSPSYSLRIPPHTDAQDFKATVCNWFYEGGCEQPVPTAAGNKAVFKGILKVPSFEFQQILQDNAVETVIYQEFGQKHYMPNDELDAFKESPMTQVASDVNGIDIGQMVRDPNNIYLFGLPANYRGRYYDIRHRIDWLVYPMLPMSQSGADNGYVYGTLEAMNRTRGADFGSGNSLLRVYSVLHHFVPPRACIDPSFPTTMQHIADRFEPYRRLTMDLLDDDQNSAAGGYRIEARSLSRGNGECISDLIGNAQTQHRYFTNLVDDGILAVRKVPIDTYITHLHALWQLCTENAVFTGMDNTGPDPDDRAQVQAFDEKAQLFCVLQAQLGLCTHRTWAPVMNWIRRRRPSDPMWLPKLPRRQPSGFAPYLQDPPLPIQAEAFDPNAPVQQTTYQKCVEIVGRCPTNPTAWNEAHSTVALAQSYVEGVEEFEDEESRLIGDMLGTRKRKGQHPYCFLYKRGWGKNPHARNATMSAGYQSKAAMVKAVVDWAGDMWPSRVSYKLPEP